MKIYVLTEEGRQGPFTKSELRRKLLAAEVSRGNLIWHAAIAEWTSLGDAFQGLDGAEDAESEQSGRFVMPPVPEGLRKRRVYKVRSREPRPFRDWLYRFLRVAR